jgi:cytochrome o ubiquinol oxidase subunit 2
MLKKVKLPLLIVLILGVIAAAVAYLRTVNIAVLNPKGTIAHQQRSLMIIASLLAVLVVVPVFAMTIIISVRYRAGNQSKKKPKYTPDDDHNRLFESLWWGIPIVIILALSVVTWTSTHALDPFKPLNSPNKPLHIQVVALQWKWLFIYPDQHVASVNVVHMPVNTPVEFEVTSDAPMNSFWIPQLGGQIYGMSGMSAQLHLMASQTGSYRGSSANISGAGFADMHFQAVASSQGDFNEWVRYAQSSDSELTSASYKTLAKPSEDAPAASMRLASNDLYDTIVMKYMGHGSGTAAAANHMQGMNE